MSRHTTLTDAVSLTGRKVKKIPNQGRSRRLQVEEEDKYSGQVILEPTSSNLVNKDVAHDVGSTSRDNTRGGTPIETHYSYP